MFEPWKVEKTITVEEMYGKANPPITPNCRGIAFKPPQRGDKFLSSCDGVAAIALCNFAPDNPRIILAPALTEIEEKYGEGATPESVWAKHCPCPEKYGEPRADGVPINNKRPIGFVMPDAHGRRFCEESDGFVWDGVVYAYRLNDWQQLYGEAITDAAALEADSVFVSAADLTVQRDFNLAGSPRRAIVGTRKRKYLQIPLPEIGDLFEIDTIVATTRAKDIVLYKRLTPERCPDTGILGARFKPQIFNGAVIVEE
jgi:hypothetical protein